MTIPQISDAQIAETAFFLWLDEGQPEGRAQDHWDRARAALETPAPKRKTARPKAKAAPARTAAATAATKPRTAKPKTKA